jgi:CHAT domain-containing protein
LAIQPNLSEKVVKMEQGLEGEFETYFGRNLAEVTQPPASIGQTLARLGRETGTKPAVLWVIPREDHLHLVLITPDGNPIVRDRYDVPKAKLAEVVQTFQRNIVKLRTPDTYLAPAQQLYRWIISPFENTFLRPQGIDTLLVCLGNGVRGLPVAALHDGQQYLLEKYNLSQIPAFNLIQSTYAKRRQVQILAMGASTFQDQNPLPAVPIELSTIVRDLWETKPPGEPWQGRSLLNQSFTLDNLQTLLHQQSFNVVHLATHADFKPGTPDNSYIQFWDTRLHLDQVQTMNWQQPPLELLVLSACRTAVGDKQAELGFAGLALQAGVKSALASLWYVSDAGTLALMGEFYRQFPQVSTKAEALRRAQLRLLKGEVRVEGDRLQLSRGEVPLPPELASAEGDFSHPFYWAGFTLISSPW